MIVEKPIKQLLLPTPTAQRDEPIRIPNNYLSLVQSAEKVARTISIGFGFASHWLKI